MISLRNALEPRRENSAVATQEAVAISFMLHMQWHRVGHRNLGTSFCAVLGRPSFSLFTSSISDTDQLGTPRYGYYP
jgi:hypothetical protein